MHNIFILIGRADFDPIQTRHHKGSVVSGNRERKKQDLLFSVIFLPVLGRLEFDEQPLAPESALLRDCE